MKTKEEHWIQSGKAKTAEIQNLARDLASRVSRQDHHGREDEIHKLSAQLSEKTKAFFDHFGPGQIPPMLQQFAHALETRRSNRGNGVHLINLINAYAKLDGIGIYDATTVSFQAVLDGFRNDDELEKLLADLVNRLRNLLKVADADLTAQIARELKQVLDELDRRSGKTMTDLMVWIDLGMKGLADFLGKRYGFDQASLVYDCLKAAVASKIRMVALYEKAENDFQVKMGLSFLSKAAKEVPEIRSEDDLKRYLPSPAETAPSQKK